MNRFSENYNHNNRVVKELPENLLLPIYHYITGIHNATDKDVSNLILKPALSNVFVIFILQYGLLALCGIFLNIYIICYIIRYKLYRDITHAFMVNLCLCHFVQCAFVLPITLLLILTQNWIFGQFLCYFIPLLQDIPLHVAIITHLLIAWDRMRWLGDPLVTRFPSFVSCCASWLSGMVIALPYPIYTTFLDLGMFLKEFQGVGICIVNLVDDMQDYTRGLFIIMYCAPATILIYLYIRTAREMRSPEGPIGTVIFEHCADIRIRQRCSQSSSNRSEARNAYTRSYDLYDAEMDVTREKRTQRYLGAMAATHIISTCPLMILRIARMILVETYENTANFDITYLMFVWIAFLPTVIVPCVYASWILSRSAKDRIRRYFHLFSRQNETENKQQPTRPSIENSVTQENTTETFDDGIDANFNEKIVSYKNTNELTVENPLRKKAHRANRNIKTRNIVDPNKRAITPSITSSSPSVLSISAYGGKRSKKHNSRGARTSVTNASPRTVTDSNCDSLSYGIPTESRHCNLSQISSTMSDEQMCRRESSSTYERDMDIIDLLQRDRSMDIQNECSTSAAAVGRRDLDAYSDHSSAYVNKRKSLKCDDDVNIYAYKINDSTPKSSLSERRKLPDISKITAPNSPKQVLNEARQNFPNFVFTHQQQSVVTVSTDADGSINDLSRVDSIPKDKKKIRRI